MKAILELTLFCATVCSAQQAAGPLWSYTDMNPCTRPLIGWGASLHDLYDSLEARNIPRGRVTFATPDSLKALVKIGDTEYWFNFREGEGLYFVAAIVDYGTTKKMKAFFERMHKEAFKNYEDVGYNEGIIHKGHCKGIYLYARVKKWGGGKVAIVLQRMVE